MAAINGGHNGVRAWVFFIHCGGFLYSGLICTLPRAREFLHLPTGFGENGDGWA